MDESIDQLTETFAAHEYLAPDAADVLEKANAIARTYCRRRTAARATGVSVLGAGLVVGAVAVPRLRWHADSGGSIGLGQPALGSAPAAAWTPSATAGPTASAWPTASAPPIAPSATRTYTQQVELAEYFADGYDYDNAVQLASLWHETDPGQAKADAGLKLLEGLALPVAPNGTPETPQEKAQGAFFAGGYDYNDAVTLGNLWQETDIGVIKAQAGQLLLDGETLPIQPSTPSESATPQSSEDQALAAYFAAGYNYNDAVTLGNLWHQTDLTQIKAEAGQKLLDGQTLPIAP
jgi:hypothetical protein